ncbi:hypothetical protein P168DRAFT_90161 [Aspergillus campestris IBT 28561]|uniref:CorA-like transporter domain-containing protein n=1 Tax=Aspergillus campestris (strain IBT 28561) TaxID=1392248 RepID=A0A2I1DBH4_ASPC2|nr:uncharacterized protein P168DRAFT_90161 [Aspergillus campestris IBT 28561]PKY07200.1 hypothetical protein P168DRAFT_90161 [Aspergillus campestris IBT 28561]
MEHLSMPSKLDHYLAERVESKATDLFQARKDRPQLEASFLYRSAASDNVWSLEKSPIVHINSAEELEKAESASSNACAQIYTIRHQRSWTTLNISHKLFQELLEKHRVFHHFWRSILTFGWRFEENEYGFPAFRAKRSQSGRGKVDEITYVIRRVERNNRPVKNGECPWSIRQTGIYHRLAYEAVGSQHKSTFILVAPSSIVDDEITKSLAQHHCADGVMNPAFAVHERLVLDSLRGWMDYMAWLESEVKQDSNRVIVSKMGTHEIHFNANDRQRLKQLEDYITDMMVILQTMADTIARIRTSCQRHCQMSCGDSSSCSCSYTIDEFEEYATEAQLYLNRAKVLKARVKSTAQLLSDLLGYEESRNLKQLAQASHQLAQASHDESHYLMELQKKSVQDAAAVKMLTIIGLVFLPSTIVANFFSTEFVKVNDQGRLHVSREVWIMAVVAVPLTAITIFFWWLLLRLSVLGRHNS